MIYIFIYSWSIREHIEHIMRVLQRLRESQFYLSRSKLDLFSDKTDCLGHIIDDNGIHTKLDKMRRIREWRIPRNYNEVQKFLGLVQYLAVGCIYAPYKVNPNIFQFYFNFLDILHHTSMHPFFCNIYEFYLIFYDFISLSIIYNNHLYLR